MTSHQRFARALMDAAVKKAGLDAQTVGETQAEESAIHMMADGLRIVPPEEIAAMPEQAAERYFAAGCPSGIVLSPESWETVALTKRQGFLLLLEAGARARDHIQGTTQADKIVDAANRTILDSDLEDSPELPAYRRNAPDSHRAALAFLRNWPDKSDADTPQWLRVARRRHQN